MSSTPGGVATASDIVDLKPRISCVKLTVKPEKTHVPGSAIQLEKGGSSTCLLWVGRGERVRSPE